MITPSSLGEHPSSPRITTGSRDTKAALTLIRKRGEAVEHFGCLGISGTDIALASSSSRTSPFNFCKQSAVLLMCIKMISEFHTRVVSLVHPRHYGTEDTHVNGVGWRELLASRIIDWR